MSQAMGQKIWSRDAALAKLRQVLPEFATKYGVTKIGLFGSVARDEAKAGSDLDVIVHTDLQTFDNYMDMQERLEAIFEVKVDLVYYREKMKPFFLAILARDSRYA
jgi:predicted nucleotidyltransferase